MYHNELPVDAEGNRHDVYDTPQYISLHNDYTLYDLASFQPIMIPVNTMIHHDGLQPWHITISQMWNTSQLLQNYVEEYIDACRENELQKGIEDMYNTDIICESHRFQKVNGQRLSNLTITCEHIYELGSHSSVDGTTIELFLKCVNNTHSSMSEAIVMPTEFYCALSDGTPTGFNMQKSDEFTAYLPSD
jgi:hypothetical protein